ncbi:MAG: ribosomal-protein-alanine N-acetyltransferase [Rubrivivax sp. SCN 71-131]|jgi:ribosomal-protein-alanine N-acetyltransferase|nr:MAG: ribosomal-protein-alanine N-acetyltransferase [Rubrivivax sp. SCN 71-131]
MVSARSPAPSSRLRPMREDDLARVLAIEQRAYGFPWTQGNFGDSLQAGCEAVLRVDAQDDILGYFVAMAGVDEMHLLNLTVAPEHQRKGHARALMAAVIACARALPATSLLLEVRLGNARARDIYARCGFAEIGRRPRYYPAAHGAREDALVLRLALDPGSTATP